MVDYNYKYKDSIFINEYKNEACIDKFISKQLDIIPYENAIVLPAINNNNKDSWFKGGVLDKNNNYIDNSSVKAYNLPTRMNGGYKYDNCEYVDETVIYIGLFINHWGHFLVDGLSRLYAGIKLRKYRLVYIGENNQCIRGNYLDFFSLLGIEKERLLLITKPTKFKKIFIPSPSQEAGGFWTNEFKDIFNVVRDKVKRKMNYDKIYLSRKYLPDSQRKEIGEAEVELFFNKIGYKSIYPEQLSLAEQISYIKNAKSVACVGGTLAHNMLFAQDKTELIILSKTYLINPNQFQINQIRELKVIDIDCHLSLNPVSFGKGPFIIYKNDNLRNFAMDNDYIITKSKFLPIYIEWYNKIINNMSLTPNTILSEYYSKKKDIELEGINTNYIKFRYKLWQYTYLPTYLIPLLKKYYKFKHYYNVIKAIGIKQIIDKKINGKL